MKRTATDLYHINICSTQLKLTVWLLLPIILCFDAIANEQDNCNVKENKENLTIRH